MEIQQVPALYGLWPFTNYGKGRLGKPIELIVIHGMGGTLPGTDSWFRNPLAHASSHFGIGTAANGSLQIHQYVKLEDTAWGVAQSRANQPFVNERAIQIEIQNQDRQGKPYVTDGYYDLVRQLVVELCGRLNRRPDRSFIRGHTELDPRKGGCPVSISVDRIVAEAQSLWDSQHEQPHYELADSGPARDVPVNFKILVTANGLNVRTKPSVSAAIVVAKHLVKNDPVMIEKAVEGDVVEGNGIWLKTAKSGLYIWSGGTNYKRTSNA